MRKFLGVIVSLTLVALVFATEVNECKSGLPLPRLVEVKDCVKGPCDFPRGKHVYWNITFDAPNDIEMLVPSLRATALGIEVDYPPSESNGCSELVVDECPLEIGQRVVYATKIKVLPIFPTIPVVIEMTLNSIDEDGNKVGFTCFQIDAQVTA